MVIERLPGAGVQNACQIVVLDGKNEQNSLCTELRIKLLLPAHIFVVQADGSFKHNPLLKGTDCSSPNTRLSEISHISELHKSVGVGAVILQPSLGTDAYELAKCIPLIKAIDSNIKIIAVGEYRGFLKSEAELHNEIHKLIKSVRKAKIIKANDDIQLVDGIDVLIAGNPNAQEITNVIHELVPGVAASKRHL